MDEEDNRDLAKTIGLIAETMPLGRGFAVSDPGQARQILEWLMELRMRRGFPSQLN